MKTLPPIIAGFLVSLASVLFSSIGRADEYLLVNGQVSNNVVRFDVNTGQAQLYANYNAGDAPRNLVVDPQGDVFASLNGGAHNIVKLVLQGAIYVPQAFTGTVSGLGPGGMAFYQGDLYAATDSGRVIDQFDASGNLVQAFSITDQFNIRAMAIGGDHLYYGEYFQDRLVKYDLTQTPPVGSPLVTDHTNLAEPRNMAVGADGNLFVTNAQSPLVQEFSATTGQFIGTFANVQSFDPSTQSAWDVLYDPNLNNYFISDSTEVFRLSSNGQLLQTYSSNLLQGIAGVAIVVPEPNSCLLAIIAACLGGIALICARHRVTR